MLSAQWELVQLPAAGTWCQEPGGDRAQAPGVDSVSKRQLQGEHGVHGSGTPEWPAGVSAWDGWHTPPRKWPPPQSLWGGVEGQEEGLPP